MASPFRWIWVVHTDVIRQGPDPAQAIVTLNLKAFGRSGSVLPDQFPPDALRFPWAENAIHGFDIWWIRPPASGQKSTVKPEGYLPLPPSPSSPPGTLVGHYRRVHQGLESGTLPRDPDRPAPLTPRKPGELYVEFPDDTQSQLPSPEAGETSWSGVLSNLSHKGFPLAHALRLAFLFEPSSHSKLAELLADPAASDHALALTPRFAPWKDVAPAGTCIGATPRPRLIVSFNPPTPAAPAAPAAPAVPTAPAVPAAPASPVPDALEIRVEPSAVTGPGVDLPTFVSNPSSLQADGFEDWRSSLPRRLGLHVQPLRWLRGVFAARNAQSPPSPATLKEQVEAVLATAHAYSDIGLRQPAWARASTVPGSTRRVATGSLVQDAIRFLHDDFRLGSRAPTWPELESSLDQLAAAGDGSHLLPRSISDWASLLQDALQGSPAAAPVTADPASTPLTPPPPPSYPRLRRLLRWYLDGAKTVGPEFADPTGAIDDLDLALQDEGVLLACWIRQWDGIFDHAPSALRWLLGALSTGAGVLPDAWKVYLATLPEEVSIEWQRYAMNPSGPANPSLLWRAAAGFFDQKPELRAGTPPEAQWLVGSWPTILPRLAPHREALGRWLSESGLPLATRYAAGVAGDYLSAPGSPSTQPIADPQPPTAPTSDENAFRTGEGTEASRWLAGAFFDFARRLRVPGAATLPFLRPSRFPDPQTDDPPPHRILGTLLWHDEAAPAGVCSESPAPTRQAWVDALAGRIRTSNLPPGGSPSPLLIPLPPGFDAERYAGMIILARRYETPANPATATDWCIVNVGDYAPRVPRRSLPPAPIRPTPAPAAAGAAGSLTDTGLEEDAALSGVPIHFDGMDRLPVPWRIFNSHGIDLTLLPYYGRPLAVDLWETFDEWPTDDGNAIAQIEPPAHWRQHLPGGPEDWGAVPGRRYDRKVTFEFLLCPIHNSGVLPEFLRAPGAEGTARFCRLGDSTRVRQALASMEAGIDTRLIRVTTPLRRVRVGQPRLAAPVGPGVDVILDPRDWPIFRKFSPFPIPRDVRPLGADILEPSPEGLHLTPARLTPPTQTVLLSQAIPTSGEPPAIRFLLRPPATEIENWSIWQASVLTTGLTPAHADFIGDVRRICRDLGYLRDQGQEEPPGFEISELLDDPAVEGFLLRLQWVFPGTSSDPIPASRASLFVPLAQGVGQRRGWSEFKTEDALGELPIGTSFFSPDIDPRPLHRIRPWIQHVAGEARNGQGTAPATVELRRSFHPQPSIARNGSRILVNIPAGSVVELQILPCIPDSEFGVRFGTCGGDGDTELFSDDSRSWRAIPDSATRLWLEAVDWVPDDATDGSRQKLTPGKVWHALRLGGVGEFSEGRRRVERLEAAVLPHEDDLRAWCFYSEVRLRVQPWRWSGLPEDAPDDLAFLLAPPSDPPTPRTDTDPGTRERLIRGELSSFAERGREDSQDSAAVAGAADDDAAASSTRPKINFVGTLLGRLRSPGTPVRPALVLQDSGEQETIARHYRVEIEVRHRYAGLHPSTGDQRIESLLSWENARQDFITTRYRRITFRGRLAEPPYPPRIKFVVPLRESLPDVPGDRPGFLALTRNTLASPFHRLIARVQWTRLQTSSSASRSDPGIVLEFPEYGPDPLTAGSGFPAPNPDSPAAETILETEGRAFGLTKERVAGNAAYPNAGFHFNPPQVAPSTAEDFAPHDWFATLSFRWEIRPPWVLEANAVSATSELTTLWTVRFLAPFRRIRFRKGAGSPAPIPISDLAFSLDSAGRPAFSAPDQNETSLVPVPPDVLARGKGKPDRSPLQVLLLFVTWTVVPDASNPTGSKAMSSLHLFTESDPQPIPIVETPPSPAGPDKPTTLASGGNFLLLLTRKEHERQLLKALELAGRKTDSNAERSSVLGEFLFSTHSRELDHDVRAMIVASSPCIHGG